MKIENRHYDEEKQWSSEEVNNEMKLVLAFFSPIFKNDSSIYNSLKIFYPNADIVFVSTSGEIFGEEVFDKTVLVSAISFEKTPIKAVSGKVSKVEDSFKVSQDLVKKLLNKDLKHVLMFGDGLQIAASEAIKGIKELLPKEVGVTGGLAGDSFDFQGTYAGLNSFSIEENNIILIGFYGDSIKIGSHALSGRSKFGMKRTITKSKGNVVYEIDGEPVLDLYKKYLGKKASQLPTSGIYFPIPISVFNKNENEAMIRSLIAVDEKEKSVTFAGDVPEGYNAYLIKTNFDALIDAAENAAEEAHRKNPNPKFALLISCAGRRVVLRQRIEEEVEAVSNILGKDCNIAGFYSYGEICAMGNGETQDYFLHNQTMNVLLISEE